MKIKNHLLKKLYWFAKQFGIDPRQMIRAVQGLPLYIRDYLHFKKGFAGRLPSMPCLHDRHDQGSITKSEYFWQDLYVAQRIFAANPRKHVDIGSRLDGFVSHVASFREIEVFDIRSISAKIPNVFFKQADLMKPIIELKQYCDSLSCLHVLEHFGLGRYGDPLDPNGYQHGLRNMAGLLKPGGFFYMSVPVGIERVEFNAHRVFNPQTILNLTSQNGLVLRFFTIFDKVNGLTAVDVDDVVAKTQYLRYSLGIFEFTKSKS